MNDIVNKLKKAKKGEFVYDSNIRVTYEILEVDDTGGMPLSIAR